MWTVNVDEYVDRKISKIPNPDKRRIQQAIYDLENGPEGSDIKPLKGRSGYRMRVGGWRLLMDIENEQKVIYVYMLASRGDVYKK